MQQHSDARWRTIQMSLYFLTKRRSYLRSDYIFLTYGIVSWWLLDHYNLPLTVIGPNDQPMAYGGVRSAVPISIMHSCHEKDNLTANDSYSPSRQYDVLSFKLLMYYPIAWNAPPVFTGQQCSTRTWCPTLRCFIAWIIYFCYAYICQSVTVGEHVLFISRCRSGLTTLVWFNFYVLDQLVVYPLCPELFLIRASWWTDASSGTLVIWFLCYLRLLGLEVWSQLVVARRAFRSPT
jgi:hypothetical protein